MRDRARSIAISSGKGGTGKTTLTANLGIALANEGHDVTILDGDLSMANLGIVMGMKNCPVSFLDVISGKHDPEEAVYEDYGVKVVPTGFRFEDIHDSISEGGSGQGRGGRHPAASRDRVFANRRAGGHDGHYHNLNRRGEGDAPGHKSWLLQLGGHVQNYPSS